MLDKDPRRIRSMFASVAHRYDTANRVLPMRFDDAWRKKVARDLLASPGLVLDLAAGTGPHCPPRPRPGLGAGAAETMALYELMSRSF